MNPPKVTVAALLRLEERLRQERETFDQRKEQESRWFSLRLRMGYLAIVMLPAIAVVSAFILLNHINFDGAVVTSAGAALFVDILGLIASVWKVVLNPGSVTKLEPIIDDEPQSLNGGASEQSDQS